MGFGFKGTSNGIAYANFDNGGDLDIVMNNLNTPAALYENQINKNKKFLKSNLTEVLKTL